MKILNINSFNCKTNFPSTSVSHKLRDLGFDANNLSSHKEARLFCDKLKIILQEKLFYISECIDEYELDVEMILGYTFLDLKNIQNIMSFEFVIKNTNGDVLGLINEDSFTPDFTPFTVTINQLLLGDAFPLFQEFANKPSSEWRLICSFFETGKSIGDCNRVASYVDMSEKYEISNYMVEKINNKILLEEKINCFLSGIQKENLYDFKEATFNSIYYLGAKNYFCMGISFEKRDFCYKFSGSIAINDFILDFKYNMIQVLIETNILNKAIGKEHKDLSIRNIFELSNLLNY